MPERRRTADAIRAVDGLVNSHLQQAPVDVHVLTNIAVAMATEYSGAGRGTLLIDDGSGLEPRFALGPGLQPAEADEHSYDAKVVEQATSAGRVTAIGEHLASPVLLAGKVRAMVYLEAGVGGFSDDVEELAGAVATRIATLLHSASLVEDAARRASNMETLEALGECLSAGALSDEHLGKAIEAALRSTGSQRALLGLLDEDGELLDLHVRGDEIDLMRTLGRDLAASIRDNHDELDLSALGTPYLFERLRADLLSTGDTDPRARGFLAVGRPGGQPFTAAERSFFRALVHLLAGALARLAYFRKASEDTLTGTGSRLALEFAFTQAVLDATQTSRPLSLVLVDVDRFKEVNDTHGHLAGDELLAAIADALRSRLRARDFVARYGGDEFLLLLPETSATDAVAVAEELRALVASTPLTEQRVVVSLSIGVATLPSDGDTARELLRSADRALYESKRGGRNRVTHAGG